MRRHGWLATVPTSIFSVAAAIWNMATNPGDRSSVHLKVGDTAPPFDLEGSDGRRYRLADFAGREAVVLAWFPKAFTGG